MNKKKGFSFKSFLKIFTIIVVSLTAVIGITVGILAITGVFKPEYVALTGISFENHEYFIENEEYIKIQPSPENTTEKNLTLTVADMQVVSAPTEVQVGVPFKITPIKTNGINNGGSTKITAYFGNLIFCETIVFVDVPVQAIEIKMQDESQTDIISGTSFDVNIAYTSEKSIKPYGDNYQYSSTQSKTYCEHNKTTNTLSVASFKVIEGNDVATINAETGNISTLKAGTFKVEAKTFKTYQAKTEYETHVLNGDFNADEWGIGTVDGKTEAEYLAERVLTTTRTFTVREVELASITVNQPQNDNYIQDIYLYETLNLTYEDLGLTLTPELNSGLTSEDMQFRLSEVVLTAVKGNDYADNSNVLRVADYLDNNGERIGWSVKALQYQDRIVSKTALKFTVTKNGLDAEDVLSTTLALNIKKNEIASGSNAFVLTSGSSENETKYTTNLNYFTYQNTVSQNELELNVVKDSFDLKQTTTIVFSMSNKPQYMTVRYFVKDFSELNYANRVIEYDQETGEIIDGIITIVKEGSVKIEAKALKIDENGEIIYTNENDKTSYIVVATANTTSGSGISTPLTVNVTEKLTNVSLELNDDNAIYLEYEEEGETKQALREAQTVGVTISAYDSSSEVDNTTKLRKTYNSKLLIEMLRNNKLEFVIENGDKFENIGISYNILLDGNNEEQINAELFIPRATFAPANNNVPQLLQKNIKFKLVLNSEMQTQYGNQAQYFEIGELKIDVQTARPKNIELTTNANVETIYKETQNGKEEYLKDVYVVKYISGGWVVGNEQESSKLEVYAQFDPIETAESSVEIKSSDERLLKINTDNESKNADTAEAESKKANDSSWLFKYLYKAQLNLQKVTSINGYSSVYLMNTSGTYTEYKYLNAVTLTFTSTDPTYKDEDDNSRDVFEEITFYLLVSATNSGIE